jgi:hypothetical protein
MCNIGFYFVDKPATGLSAAADQCVGMLCHPLPCIASKSRGEHTAVATPPPLPDTHHTHTHTHPAACTLANSNNRGVLCNVRDGAGARGNTTAGFLCNPGFFQVRVGTAPNLVTCSRCGTCAANEVVRTSCTQTANTTCARMCTVKDVGAAVNATACALVRPNSQCTLVCAKGADPVPGAVATISCPATGNVELSAAAFQCAWRMLCFFWRTARSAAACMALISHSRRVRVRARGLLV